MGHIGRVQDCVSEPEPIQLAPLYCGVGLLHCLVLVQVPVSHVTEQVPKDVHAPQLPSIGQLAISAHDFVSAPDPVQELPPCCGAGLLHCLLLDWVPVEHVTEHEVQVVQLPQLPLIGHGPMSQLTVSDDAPIQTPLPMGAGLLHVLDLVLVPVVHETVQEVQDDQAE